MTGKQMLMDMEDLDADLIEEGELGEFKKGKDHMTKKKGFLILIAATLIMGTLTGAAVYTRWSNSMQYRNPWSPQPSEQIKQQAEKTGLSVVPKETTDGAAVTATDQGITVTVAQTVMDQYGGTVVFRISGFDLPEGKKPWCWWDYTVDGEDVHWSSAAHFFNGMTLNDEGEAVYAKNGEPIPREGENQGLVMDYQDNEGNIEYSIDFDFPEADGRYFGKEMSVTFTGFGIQGERFEDPETMTVPGTWELPWALEGCSVEPKTWTPYAELGAWGITLVEAEIGQYSMKTTYRLDEKYKDAEDFHEKTGWSITPAGVRLKDGTDLYEIGGGAGRWDAEKQLVTTVSTNLSTVLDPEQIAGMYFYAGYDLNENGYRVDRPYYYVPLA